MPAEPALLLPPRSAAAAGEGLIRHTLATQASDLYWVVPFASVTALATGLPRLWGASEDAGAIVALFLSTSLAFGAFIDEEAVLSMFFPAAKAGVQLSSRIRAFNLLIGHMLVVSLTRICEPQAGRPTGGWEFSLAFMCLSYIDVMFGMACAARRRAFGREPDLALYTSAAGPAVVYTVFLAYVAVRLDVAFLQLVLATDSLIVFTLPLIHVMVFGPHITSLLSSFFELRLQPEAVLYDGVDDARAGLRFSAPRVAYVALCVTLWWHTAPLRVAMLLRNTPKRMYASWRTLTNANLPAGVNVVGMVVVVLGGILLSVMLFLTARRCCRGCARFSALLRGAREGHAGRHPVDVETSVVTLSSMLEENEVTTRIVECGWGTSFHFADRHPHETHLQSLLRHQYFLAGKLAVQPGACLLDCGCGVGGPARNIARFTGSRVVAVTTSRFQVERGNCLSLKEGVHESVELMQADSAQLPFPDASFDAVYAIESTCRAVDRAATYREIYRVLKPGGTFASYEWCLTDKYDALSDLHREIRDAIETGNGFKQLSPASCCEGLLRSAGFQVRESRDYAVGSPKGSDPWYLPLTPSYNPMSWPRFQFTPVMSLVMPRAFRLAERFGVLPPRADLARAILQAGGVGLAKGGREGIFTPMWLLVARKAPRSPSGSPE